MKGDESIPEYRSMIEQTWPSIQKQVIAFAYSRTKSRDLALDIAQETFVRLWKQKDQVMAIKNLEAWCITVAKRLIIDHMRKEKKVVDIDTSEVRTLSGTGENALEAVQKKELIQLVRTLIKSLPEQQRKCIVLRDIEGFTYNEIAEELKITLHAVKVNIFRGRKQIKDQLLKLANYESI